MHKGFIKTAAFLGAISVALGAFAAHTLKEKLSADSLAIFETAVKYQMYHVFAILFIGLVAHNQKLLIWSGRLFLLGIIFFSGSLYFLTFIKAQGWDSLRWVGAITPIGGLSFITGWIFLAIGISQISLTKDSSK